AIIGNYMIRARIGYEVPEPEITNLESGSMTNQPSITVEGNAYTNEDVDAMVRILVNGSASEEINVMDDGTYSGTIELSEGENELLVVSVINDEETSVSDPVIVTLDTKNPELTVDTPSDGDKTNRETITIEGSISDEHIERVTVNGQMADISDGSYSKRVLLDNGKNTIEVIAEDKAGNETTESVVIDAKYDAPKVKNLNPDKDVDLEIGK